MAQTTAADEAHNFCTNCEQTFDHSTPVNCSHSSTGESGCPECLTATLKAVVETIGDERTVAGGYVPSGSRDADGQIELATIDA